MTENSGSEYVPVYTANGTLAAEMIRGFLESQGIPAMIRGESAGSAYGFTMGPMGEVEIYVPQSRAEEAEGLLNDMEEGKFDVPLEGGEIIDDEMMDEEGEDDEGDE